MRRAAYLDHTSSEDSRRRRHRACQDDEADVRAAMPLWLRGPAKLDLLLEKRNTLCKLIHLLRHPNKRYDLCRHTS